MELSAGLDEVHVTPSTRQDHKPLHAAVSVSETQSYILALLLGIMNTINSNEIHQILVVHKSN